MKLRAIKKPSQEMELFAEVEMDEGIFYFKNNVGFKTYGVSSCIVFVAYYRNKPLCMMHWSTPDSQAHINKVNRAVSDILTSLAMSIANYNIDLNEVTVYALGGQESSHKTIVSLSVQSKLKNKPFTLNVDYLFIAPCEDYFDLYVHPGAETFWIVHHPIPVTTIEIAEAKAQITDSLDMLGLYCYELHLKGLENHRRKPAPAVFDRDRRYRCPKIVRK